MNEIWTCLTGNRKIVARLVSVVTAYELRQYAARKFGVDPGVVELRPENTEGAAEPTVELRWEGDDYNYGGGSKDSRRLQERVVGYGSIRGDWVDA